MYTKEELSSMKYGELLKILKKLGLKGTRQKTGKVIELILQNQSIEPEAGEVSIPSSKENTQTENDDGNEISNVLYSEREILQSSPNSENKECHMLSNPNRRRTRTFIITKAKDTDDSDGLEKDIEEKDPKRSKGEESLLEVSAVEESLLNISGCLSRSSTFIFEDFEDDLPNDSLTSSLDVKRSSDNSSIPAADDYKREENNEQDVLPYSNVDLSCKEIETAEDIEGMESGQISSSPVNNSRNRRTIRRSLRGQLLVSKINNHESLAPSLSAPLIENPTSEFNERNSSCNQQSSLIFKPNFSVPKSFDFGKDSNTVMNGSSSKSGIPRFISSARKGRMPNFTKIHENAFKKMEALDEYVERKHTRTLSTTDKKKPNIKGDTVQVRKEREIASGKRNIFGKRTDKETGKKLVFKETPGKKLSTPVSSSSSTRRSSTMASLTKNTPTRNGRESLSFRLKTASSSPDKVSGSVLPTLVKENLPPNSPINVWNKPTIPCNSPGSLNRRKCYIPSISKPNIKPDINGSSVNVLAKQRAAYAGKSDNAINRREMLKKATSRKPNVKSSAEIRASEKVFIKGVRTNRRFELQMARRGITPA